MRLERITFNKIKVSLSSDDLFHRGISNEDIWKDSNKWHQLFHEMVDEASDEFGVDIRGQVAVEVFSLQTQGMIMIITLEDDDVDEEDVYADNFIEMQVTVGGCEDCLFEFNNFEDIIQLSQRLISKNVVDGKIYFKDDKYFLLFDHTCNPLTISSIAFILSEYGAPSLVTSHVLQEYGTVIMENKAIERVSQYFK
ncbi:genetic competence negative regulator [Neobacillus sp. D3-1R]|uniref:genetic competence negative regulator n=1 Tax=Neobacillus sp. D3-1R TaxID=3445778 RepID=UPI003F9F3770